MSESQISRILLERFQAGDELAAGELWDRYACRLKVLAGRRLFGSLAKRVDAEDILQTTFFEFFEKAKKDNVLWRERGDLWRLLASIAIHHVARQAEHFRAAKRDLARETNVNVDRHFAFDDGMVAREIDQIIEPLLADPILSAVVSGRLAGKTLLEIAAEIGKSERTLRRKLERVKLALIADSEIFTGHELSVPTDDFRDANYADYDLLKMLGAGGFGKVYLARDRIRDCFVAVKALRRDWIGNANAESLFLNEAATVAKLNHPNIVGFQKIGPLPNGSWFMVLDYLKGKSLDALCTNEPGWQTVIGWITQICEAMAYLHSQNIVHGDLKPANILVESDSVYLVDFGFSCHVKSGEVWRGGTRSFTAPERQVSFAADVFSLGKVIGFIVGMAAGLDEKTQQLLDAIVGVACSDNARHRPTCRELLSRIKMEAGGKSPK